MDGSKSLILVRGGQALPREKDAVDYYYFGNGRDYLKAIQDFYKLSGATPMSDPERFLRFMHDHRHNVTLNLHPSDGVKAYEEMYREMAQALDVILSNEDPILFDLCDPRFLEAYFKYLHHPNEKISVDFWWIDWQQGKNSSVKGLDPLWMLNHYHTYGNRRNGKRALILSRYADPGSHRYPLTFRGFHPPDSVSASPCGMRFWS